MSMYFSVPLCPLTFRFFWVHFCTLQFLYVHLLSKSCVHLLSNSSLSTYSLIPLHLLTPGFLTVHFLYFLIPLSHFIQYNPSMFMYSPIPPCQLSLQFLFLNLSSNSFGSTFILSNSFIFNYFPIPLGSLLYSPSPLLSTYSPNPASTSSPTPLNPFTL